MSLQEVYEKIIQLVQLISTNKPSEHDQILTLLQCVQNDDVRLDVIKDHHKFTTLDEAFHAILSNTAARAHNRAFSTRDKPGIPDPQTTDPQDLTHLDHPQDGDHHINPDLRISPGHPGHSTNSLLCLAYLHLYPHSTITFLFPTHPLQTHTRPPQRSQTVFLKKHVSIALTIICVLLVVSQVTGSLSAHCQKTGTGQRHRSLVRA
jgi:hypothetical protein